MKGWIEVVAKGLAELKVRYGWPRPKMPRFPKPDSL
jgi:hypothetical protein